MICPQCKTEYIEGVDTCADCQVPLVSSLPPSDKEEPVENVPGPEYGEYTIVYTTNDSTEANIVLGFLTAQGMEAQIVNNSIYGYSFRLTNAVAVPSEQEKEAQGLIAEYSRKNKKELPSFDLKPSPSEAPDSKPSSPAVRPSNCPQCKALCDPDATYCDQCGTLLDTESAQGPDLDEGVIKWFEAPSSESAAPSSPVNPVKFEPKTSTAIPAKFPEPHRVDSVPTGFVIIKALIFFGMIGMALVAVSPTLRNFFHQKIQALFSSQPADRIPLRN